MPTTGLAARIKKKNPFSSRQQEAHLNLALTVAILSEPFIKLFKAKGLSESTYNVLRILRGEHPDGVPVLEIRRRMINRVPDVTRLVDRLEQLKLCKRERCERDRRIIYCHITPKGIDLLADMDTPVTALHGKLLTHMSDAELEKLSELLEKARAPWDTDQQDTDLEAE
jgi:DNA-binding MarR family transcriptional regulator